MVSSKLLVGHPFKAYLLTRSVIRRKDSNAMNMTAPLTARVHFIHFAHKYGA
jgi:hypothetical protein